jgi:hypothetical protein
MDYAITEGRTKYEESLSKDVAQILTTTYPGHNWWVEILDGMLRIKSMKISPNAAMVVPLRKFDNDAGRLKREVVMKAGEFLEAANLRRGSFQGQNATVLEGMPTGQRARLMPQPRDYVSNGIVVTDV